MLAKKLLIVIKQKIMQFIENVLKKSIHSKIFGILDYPIFYRCLYIRKIE